MDPNTNNINPPMGPTGAEPFPPAQPTPQPMPQPGYGQPMFAPAPSKPFNKKLIFIIGGIVLGVAALLLVLFLVILPATTPKLSCTKSDDDSSYVSSKTDVTFYFNGALDEITKIDVTTTGIFDDEDDAKTSYDYAKKYYKKATVTKSGKTVTMKETQIPDASGDFDADLEIVYRSGYTREEIKERMEETDFTCK